MALDLNQWYPGDVSFLPGRSDKPSPMFERPPSLKFIHPLPYGAILHEGGVQFVVFSRSRHGDAGAACTTTSTTASRAKSSTSIPI